MDCPGLYFIAEHCPGTSIPLKYKVLDEIEKIFLGKGYF